MKTKTLLLTAATCLLTLAGCKTTEKNYREAYERTMNAATDSTRLDFDDTVYGRHRRAVVNTTVGDGLPARVVAVDVTTDGGGFRESLKKYCVCAAGFKQLFNARSVRERLVTAGYPAAFIVQTAEPYYFVIAASYVDLDGAALTLKALQTDPPFPLLAPYPDILIPARLNR